MLNQAIEKFVELFNVKLKDSWTSAHFAPPIVKSEFNGKWCKIWRCELRNDQYERTSIYAFIALQDFVTKGLGQVVAGQIFKPASIQGPTKHARGSVFDQDSGLACAGLYGIVNLK